MPLSNETRDKIIRMIQEEMADELDAQRSKAREAAALNEKFSWYIKIPYLKIPYVKIPYIKIG